MPHVSIRLSEHHIQMLDQLTRPNETRSDVVRRMIDTLTIPTGFRAELFDLYDRCCAYCCEPCDDLQITHRVSVCGYIRSKPADFSAEDINSFENLVPSCPKCSSSKAHRDWPRRVPRPDPFPNTHEELLERLARMRP